MSKNDAWIELATKLNWDFQRLATLMAVKDKLTPEQLQELVKNGPDDVLKVADHFRENRATSKSDESELGERKHVAYKIDYDLLYTVGLGLVGDKLRHEDVPKVISEGPKGVLEVDKYFSKKREIRKDKYALQISEITGFKYDTVEPYLNGLSREQKEDTVNYTINVGKKFNLEEFGTRCSELKKQKE